MLSISITAKNGIATSGTMLINPKNIVFYKDNTSAKAVIRYDADPGGRDKPVSYTATISKADLDLLIPAQNSITILGVTEVNPNTGDETSMSINESYISKINLVRSTINGVLGDNVELQYSDGGFIGKRIFISEAIDEIVFVYPVNLNKLVYTAFLLQETASDPVATVLEDTIGGVWEYNTVGTYSYVKEGAFTLDKTVPGVAEISYDVTGNKITFERTDSDTMTLKTYGVSDTEVLADGVIIGQYVHIEIFK